ncbi:hypothetical protein PMKS-003426 [Pichia membranifaciens]|uniref:BRO1 domain-containing protein n=1 Tax=Pichia membranifaciens TaxID=4926 RepID=A0A1Q2YK51_9ASCO|nr:hypothetical protein PMKS-003426 [Pichia membranifaciens]
MASLDRENGLLYLTPNITSSVNFGAILGDVIDNRFHQSSELFKQDIQLITDLRYESFPSRIEDVNLEVITKLKKYCNSLTALISIFPDDVVPFQWSKSIIKSLNVEKLYIVYQLASYYSILAVKESKRDEEGLKKSGIYFQYSAGCLGIVHQLLYQTPLQSFPLILKEVEALKTVMLAQSQEMYLQKAKLDQLKGSILLKLAIQLYQNGSTSNLFIGLIPLQVVGQVCEYQSRFEDFINCEIVAPIEKLNQQIHELFISSNIETEINKLTSNCELPTLLIQSREKLMQLGNLEKIANSINNLQELKLKCRFKLDNVWQLLKDQTVEEESLAKYYGYDKWNLGVLEDDKVGAILINSFKIYENYMKQSEEGDKLICTQIEELKPFLEIYNDEKLLKSYVPETDVLVLNPSLPPIIDSLREVSMLLQRLEGERVCFLKKVKKKGSRVRIIDQYRHRSSKSRMENVSASTDNLQNLLGDILKDEILKFNDELEYLGSTKITQDEFISKFSTCNIELINLKDRLKISAKRKEALHVLDSTYQGFFEVVGNLNQGKDFYQNLLDNVDVKMNQLDNFLGKRAESRRFLQEKLKSSY